MISSVMVLSWIGGGSIKAQTVTDLQATVTDSASRLTVSFTLEHSPSKTKMLFLQLDETGGAEVMGKAYPVVAVRGDRYLKDGDRHQGLHSGKNQLTFPWKPDYPTTDLRLTLFTQDQQGKYSDKVNTVINRP